MARKKLSASQREALGRLSRIIFANPFSDEREAADHAFVHIPDGTPYNERMDMVIDEAGRLIASLVDSGNRDIRDFRGQDRTLLENAFLFEVFHHLGPSFDELISEQFTRKDDYPCPVSFAGEAISMIERYGFSHDEAVHYFCFFFQMRRAYYFIHRGIVGKSPVMKQLRLDLWNNVFTHDIMLYARNIWSRMEDYSTLLLGETGTGKGIAASAIGRSGYIPFDEGKGCFSESFSRAFVWLNLSQFSEQLIESELFGHKKGSFTGATADHKGVFSRCSPHGAIFLDEIGEVSVPVQIKLLQVLQDREYSPVGSHEKMRFSGRVVAATNRPMQALRSEGGFRDDFFYRLCTDIITVPPLRERIRQEPGELDDLIGHMLSRIVGESSPDMEKSVKADIRGQVPGNYAWPGNVRELEQCIRRVLLKRRYEVEGPLEEPKGKDAFIRAIAGGELSYKGLVSGYCGLLYEAHGTYEAVSKRTGLDRRTVKKYVRDFIN
ncbi:MAG: sigma-54-dependent Fis family transcriptional regulator [Thermodesulfovibrionales bacterium]|nr:sigma-54-dependent Fis family transcriptional regulator [Thermodesulfovibrionales bacterium]